MECQKSKKLWKPPSFEDFNVESQCKRMRLERDDDARDEEVSAAEEPKTVNDLATHPKKIEEIRNWFEREIRSRASLLLITGPSGSAKTTTLKTVVSSLGIGLREWINPVDKTDFGNVLPGEFAESGQCERFEDFVFRASRYKSLFESASQTVVLVEDFPNVFIWKPKLFHEFLDKYRRNGRSPLVFICTDDSHLNLRNELFPSSVKSKFAVTEIKFNPVNHTSLMRVLKKAHNRSLSQEVLQSIAANSNGDLRNALCNLRILTESNKANKAKKSARRKDAKSETSSVSVKDAKAEFFQALGRVLYPKTTDVKSAASNSTHRIFFHDVMELADSFTDSFFVLLQENYVATFRDVKSVAEAASILSLSDVYLSRDEGRDFASLMTVIGLMLHNKNPKKEGFKPLKKSTAVHCATGTNATSRVLNTDVIPYMKVLGEKSASPRALDPGDDGDDIEEFEE